MSPPETKEAQRQQNQATPTRCVIIALTASTFEEKRGEIIAAGCDDFVRKPFQEQIIFEKMASYLGVRYVYQELPALVTGNNMGYAVSTEQPDAFFLPLLAAVPRNWLEELDRAANDVNEELAIELVGQISDSHPILAQALKDLLENYRLDRIVNLTQSILLA